MRRFKQATKRALTTVGRFAFCGWALFTGTIAACFVVAVLFEGPRSIPDNIAYALALGFFGGLLGAAGGAALAVVALVLERLIKRPPASAETADEPVTDPSVWPPPPKPPQ